MMHAKHVAGLSGLWQPFDFESMMIAVCQRIGLPRWNAQLSEAIRPHWQVVKMGRAFPDVCTGLRFECGTGAEAVRSAGLSPNAELLRQSESESDPPACMLDSIASSIFLFFSFDAAQSRHKSRYK